MYKLGINDDGWRIALAALPLDEIVERMGETLDRVMLVLAGEVEPSSRFIAAALSSIPMRFVDLFTVGDVHAEALLQAAR